MKKILKTILTTLICLILVGCINVKPKENEECTIIFNADCSSQIDYKNINYTYFPKYFREKTVNKLYDTNSKLAEEKVEYEPGKVILLLKDIKDLGGISVQSKIFGSGGKYGSIYASSSLNLFGETYYEYKGYFKKMSGLEINNFKYIYTHCGFNIEMLMEENLYFEEISNKKNLDLEIFNEVPGNILFSITITKDMLSLPEAYKKGYEFLHWEQNNEIISKIYFEEGKKYELIAKWDPIKYKITYDLDGGTNNENNPLSYTIEDETIVLQDPYKEGYTFIGWTTGSDNTPVKGLEIPHNSIGDKTFKAVFELE